MAFAERLSHTRGLEAMQPEPLFCTWRHLSKEFLDGWYRRMGYEVIRARSIDDLQLALLLATP